MGEGIARLEGTLELPDEGAPLVRKLTGDFDVARLVRLTPAWLLPVHAEGGKLRVKAREFALDAPTQGSTVDLEGEVRGLVLNTEASQVRVGELGLKLTARPREGGLHAEGELRLAEALVNDGLHQAQADHLTVSVDETWDARGAVGGRAELTFASLRIQAPRPLTFQDGRVILTTYGLRVQPAPGQLLEGELRVEAESALAELLGVPSIRTSELRVVAELAAKSGGALSGEARSSAARLRVVRPEGLLHDAPLDFTVVLRGVTPNVTHVERSRGRGNFALALGALEVSLDVEGRGDRLLYGMRASLPRLGEFKALRDTPARHAGVSLRSQGTLAHLESAAPTLEHTSELSLTRVSFSEVSARALTLHLTSRGTLRAHEGTAILSLEDAAYRAFSLGDVKLSASTHYDADARHLALEVEGIKPLAGSLRTGLTLDADTLVLRFACEGETSKPVGLKPLLPDGTLAGVDLSKLGLTLHAEGAVEGLFVKSRRGELTLRDAPLHALGVTGTIDVGARDIHWSLSDANARAPYARVRTSFFMQGDERRVATDLELDQAEFRMGTLRAHVQGLRDRSAVTLKGDVLRGALTVTQDTTIRAIEQNFAPGYPVGELTLRVRGKRGEDGVYRADELYLENRAGGSVLKGAGAAELGGDFNRLTLHGRLEQNLARAWRNDKELKARGTMAVDVSVASPNFRVFRTTAVVHLNDADLSLPGAHISLRTIDAEVPVTLDFTLSRAGARLLRGVAMNPYASLRFSDQHPLLSTRSFLSIKRVDTPVGTFAPLAGNLHVQQNIVSLSQFELGVRGGIVSGNALFDWGNARHTFELAVRASGVRSSHGEPFDGNASLLIDLKNHSVRGRADILRIGRRHLLDLLDIQDPLHTDPSIGTIRKALRLGYPERVRISFKHGFASAGVSFGGLARFLRVDDVRGIPIGPLVEKVAQLFTGPEAP